MTTHDTSESSPASRNTRSHLASGSWRGAVLAALSALVAACAGDVTSAPRPTAALAHDLQLGALDAVWNVQLRELPPNPVRPGDPYYGYGHLQLRAGSLTGDACLPPNPITPPPGSTLLSLCGRIFNEGGAAYRGGGLYAVSFLGEGPGLVAAFNGVNPSDACRRYDIAGAVIVTDAIAADMLANPTRYQVQMFGDIAGASTGMGGLLDGTAWGSVGRAETDPFFTAKICSVVVTP
jgi:hypothetical protein